MAINNSIVSGNSATSPNGDGGGISNDGAMAITDSSALAMTGASITALPYPRLGLPCIADPSSRVCRFDSLALSPYSAPIVTARVTRSPFPG